MVMFAPLPLVVSSNGVSSDAASSASVNGVDDASTSGACEIALPVGIWLSVKVLTCSADVSAGTAEFWAVVC